MTPYAFEKARAETEAAKLKSERPGRAAEAPSAVLISEFFQFLKSGEWLERGDEVTEGSCLECVRPNGDNLGPGMASIRLLRYNLLFKQYVEKAERRRLRAVAPNAQRLQLIGSLRDRAEAKAVISRHSRYMRIDAVSY